jgi:outer membrane protein OmpA-like peptidoglycan-associated protein
MKNKSSGKSMRRGVALRFGTLAVGTILSISLSACVFIHSSTIGETTGSGSAVRAEDSDYGILRLTKPEGLTSTANADLLKQCQSGLLTDVQTQLSMRDWFLIVQYYTVNANAVCKPPPPPPPPPLPPPQVKQKLVLRGVQFDFNKSKIRPGDAAVLDEAVSTLKANPNVTVNVNGYCDAIGGEEYNLKLSDRRADAVEDYLEKAGIPASRLIPHGYGKTNFIATNDTAEGRAQNRRVELMPND